LRAAFFVDLRADLRRAVFFAAFFLVDLRADFFAALRARFFAMLLHENGSNNSTALFSFKEHGQRTSAYK
jgi:hypothetical protein